MQTRPLAAALTVAIACLEAPALPAQGSESVTLRGREQLLRVYGSPRGDPVLVLSGDGGWIHLAPHIAELLAGRGYHVVGFDVRAYLAAFTSRTTTLDPRDEPRDFAVLARVAAGPTGKKPVLIGVSEGGALAVLGATDAETKASIAGVIGVGLPDRAELGWRWRDAITYLTHRLPGEPTFRTSDVAAEVAPVPLAAIHSTSDEYVPLADIHRIVSNARDPKHLWMVDASNHRFSGNLSEFDARMFDAIAWVRQNAPR